MKIADVTPQTEKVLQLTLTSRELDVILASLRFRGREGVSSKARQGSHELAENIATFRKQALNIKQLEY
jgi:hypothetical protein